MEGFSSGNNATPRSSRIAHTSDFEACKTKDKNIVEVFVSKGLHGGNVSVLLFDP